MTKHPRIPALVAVGVTAALGLGLLAGTGQFRSADLAHTSLEALEKQIVGCKDPAVWSAYGDRLKDGGRFTSAAKAYERALALQPDLVGARMNTAVALAESRDADAFFAYFTRLTALYPKVAVDLLERPELSTMRGDPRWELSASAARTQAVD